MGNTVEPKVFLIGESKVDQEGLQALLDHLGVPDWKSDAPSDIELMSEVYGRACYRSFGIELNPNLTRVRRTNKSYLTNIIEKGDGSVLEHGVANFFFSDVSRVFTHELVRHRVGTAMSQESLRFVRLTDLDWYAPVSIRESEEAMTVFAPGHLKSSASFRLSLPSSLNSMKRTRLTKRKRLLRQCGVLRPLA